MVLNKELETVLNIKYSCSNVINFVQSAFIMHASSIALFKGRLMFYRRY